MPKFFKQIAILLGLCLAISSCSAKTDTSSSLSESKDNGSLEYKTWNTQENIPSGTKVSKGKTFKQESAKSKDDLANLSFGGTAFVSVNNNKPEFSEKDKKRKDAFETYSELDKLGRCGVAYANICEETMPTEERGRIGMVKPTGWHTVKYDCVQGKYLYNRCHLIGYQLAGENANEKNLITGTRYLNIEGMLPFENMVADYVKETNNHVLYRVTPIYSGSDLVAKGVQMEAYSVEDKGKGVSFNIYCFNAQPQIEIDYATGESHLK